MCCICICGPGVKSDRKWRREMNGQRWCRVNMTAVHQVSKRRLFELRPGFRVSLQKCCAAAALWLVIITGIISFADAQSQRIGGDRRRRGHRGQSGVN